MADRLNMACLRRQMAKLGLTNDGLAQKGGWSSSTVREWTSGRHAPSTPAKRAKLAQVLKVKYGELYRNVRRGTPRRAPLSARAKARRRQRAKERQRARQQASLPAGEQHHIQVHLGEDVCAGAQLELPLEIRVLPPRRILQEALEELQQAALHIERAIMLQVAVEAAGGKE